ncbi:flagellar export protein FliJ [Vibrio ostreicida]|uniref:Flagellar export protein FliJ n=1 Tax=Vibrio ostreicida TaxID=526588 RepID=A0ABT8C059_9VIBR|nr:flagellar export protein FliJ [Vibrio ostreicida]MDN3612776.1 flagellar export protein FliJ [Vibrio ostreicida]
MEEKWLAVEKFHKLEQKKRDIMSTQLESMRKKQATASLHLDQLSVLKGQMKPKPLQSNGVGLHREAFINCSRVDQMLGKMILHQEQEQALMEAECLSLTHQLATKYKRVKILETP